jgi:FkbM family methyltransferase
MLMDLAALTKKYGIAPTGVLHLGAHLAEEAGDYARLYPRTTVHWVEANPAVHAKIAAKLRRYHRQQLIPALIADVDDEVRPFHVTNYDGMSSSLLEFGTHPEFSPDTVFVDHLELPTTTVDTLVASFGITADFLVMDLQGAELMALRGATQFLHGVRWVMSEVNKAEVYVGCAQVDELDELLAGYGLERVETHWVGEQGWGDAAWIKS